MGKKWSKIENKIHRFDNRSNEDSRNIFFAREALIFGKVRPKNLGKMVKNEETLCYAISE